MACQVITDHEWGDPVCEKVLHHPITGLAVNHMRKRCEHCGRIWRYSFQVGEPSRAYTCGTVESVEG